MKTILYDMDGTLVYFQIDYIKARRAAINVLEKWGLKNRYNVKNTITSAVDDARIVFGNEYGYSDEKIGEILNEVNDAIVTIEEQAAHIAKPITNIEHLLRFGKKHNLQHIICTYNTHRVAELTLKTAKLYQYIDDIYGRDDVDEAKPSTVHLNAAIEKYSIKPENTILIGDHGADIQLGVNFGCTTIAVITEHNKDSLVKSDFSVEQSNIADDVMKIIKDNFTLM
ncbi:MAG: HAD-IA family hydrolase [Candidatus Lokiarchaeota archaeon]|nr:HAD-IA family hydrolase [Candidatus Lokiarchaeota archaeon]